MFLWNAGCDGKIPEMDQKNSDPNNDGQQFFSLITTLQQFFYPNSDGNNFYDETDLQQFFFLNNDAPAIFLP